ncbi:MAG: VOC family protein [Kiloniellales bacterium]|nr:VOC family protein [Kiloniellales bacterium]
MPFQLNQIGQIGIGVSDVDRAEAFYGETLGLRKLFRFGDLLFFDCAGVRLFIEKAGEAAEARQASPIYFRCADIALAVHALEGRGVHFSGPPHLIAKMDDHDLWMVFFADPDGHTLALMQEAPKGYKPAHE